MHPHTPRSFPIYLDHTRNPLRRVRRVACVSFVLGFFAALTLAGWVAHLF